MATLPFFSVIIPTHKRALLLRRALESIKSQVSPVECEVIVISDAEDGETNTVCAELLSQSDMYIRRNGKNGPSASRNLGLSLVKGRFVMFLDDDDAWHPNCLANLHAQPHVQLSLTSEVYIKNQVHMSCFAFPKQLLQGIEFDPFMRAYEDWDYLLSVFNRAMPTYVPLLGSRVFEVEDATTDRRGSSEQAQDFNAVLDYLYVYRRHPAPTSELKQKRASLLSTTGLPIDQGFL